MRTKTKPELELCDQLRYGSLSSDARTHTVQQKTEKVSVKLTLFSGRVLNWNL